MATNPSGAAKTRARSSQGPGNGRPAFTGAIDLVDDPGLRADCGDDPPGRDGDKPQRRGEDEAPQQPGTGERSGRARPPAAPGGEPVPGDQTHDAETDTDHD